MGWKADTFSAAASNSQRRYSAQHQQIYRRPVVPTGSAAHEHVRHAIPLVTWRSRIGRTNRRMTAGRAQEQPLRDAADLAAAMLLKQQHGFPNLARYLRRIPPTKSAPRRAPLAASCPMIMVNGSLRLFLDALQAWQI